MKLPKKIPGLNAKDCKKGIMTFNFIAFIPRIIFLIVALVCCVILIRLMINSKFDVKPIQAEILVQGLLYGPGGITYYDPLTGRIYPEIIDPAQWDEKKLNMGFSFLPKNTFTAARITLTSQKKYNDRWYAGKPLTSIVGGIVGLFVNTKSKYVTVKSTTTANFEKSVYYNKEWWDYWEPLAKAKIKGLGGVDIDNTELPVLYWDEKGNLHSGWVYVTVLQPK